MMIPGYTQLIYGLLVFIGGLIGHYIAQSLPSLVMGTIFAILIVASALAMMQNILSGYYAGTILTALLSVFFIYRFVLTAKFMPSGLMAVISLGVLLVLFFAKKKEGRVRQ